MVSYLVMKNNIRRSMKKKSTWLGMLLIPLLLIITGSVSVRMENKQIRVGILGSEEYVQAMSVELGTMEGVLFETAREDTIHTDHLMRKYHVVLQEGEDSDELSKLRTSANERPDQGIAQLNARKRMVSMLLTIYMTVSTLYAMGYLRDKGEGAVERVHVCGGRKGSYLLGCFGSCVMITGVQLVFVLLCWKLFDSNFTYSIIEMGKLFAFILVVSNLYGIVVTRISKSEMMAGILGSSGAALFSLLGGTFVAVEQMPHFLQLMSYVSPMSWLMHFLA